MNIKNQKFVFLAKIISVGIVMLCMITITQPAVVFGQNEDYDQCLLQTNDDYDVCEPFREQPDPNAGTITGLENPIPKITSISGFVAELLDIVLTVGTPIVAFFLILSGFMFVAARGNTEKLATAKKSLLYTIIGAALLLGAWVFAQAIAGTINEIAK